MDGSVRFLKNSIDCWKLGVVFWGVEPVTPPGVYQALGTRAGGEVISSEQY